MVELTAFVREAVLPGGPGTIPKLDPRFCHFRLRYGPSPIHRWGIFSEEAIPARRRVIRYTGQRIDAREAWRRRFRQHLYLFWLSSRFAIDGVIGGSGAEFINHSCVPNLYASVGRGRIVLVSLRAIAAGEELTLDYHLTGNCPDIPCLCGAAACRGRLQGRGACSPNSHVAPRRVRARRSTLPPAT